MPIFAACDYWGTAANAKRLVLATIDPKAVNVVTPLASLSGTSPYTAMRLLAMAAAAAASFEVPIGDDIGESRWRRGGQSDGHLTNSIRRTVSAGLSLAPGIVLDRARVLRNGH